MSGGGGRNKLNVFRLLAVFRPHPSIRQSFQFSRAKALEPCFLRLLSGGEGGEGVQTKTFFPRLRALRVHRRGGLHLSDRDTRTGPNKRLRGRGDVETASPKAQRVGLVYFRFVFSAIYLRLNDAKKCIQRRRVKNECVNTPGAVWGERRWEARGAKA